MEIGGGFSESWLSSGDPREEGFEEGEFDGGGDWDDFFEGFPANRLWMGRGSRFRSASSNFWCLQR